MGTKSQATIEDLYRVPENGKAELVDGEVRRMSPTGGRPGRAAIRITASLLDYEESVGGGLAFGDNVGFRVNLPHRASFSPDAAWYVGEMEGLQFLKGAPLLAVEGRSENDYGPRAEQENPTLLVEVLSKSPEAYDRGDKFAHYRRLSSLQEYILISQERVHVERFVREGASWRLTEYSRLTDEVLLEAIGCSLSLREVYAKVEFADENSRSPAHSESEQ